MPYIITTREWVYAEDWDVVSRRAVATLDEARIEAWRAIDPAGDTQNDHVYAAWERDADRLPESGGTIGPLPDGTVIEVERVEIGELYGRVLAAGSWLNSPLYHAEIIDAYNAAQED